MSTRMKNLKPPKPAWETNHTRKAENIDDLSDLLGFKGKQF